MSYIVELQQSVYKNAAIGSGGSTGAITFEGLKGIAGKYTYLAGLLIEISASLTQTSGADTITVAVQQDFLSSISYEDGLGTFCNALSGRQLVNILEAEGIWTVDKLTLTHGATLSGNDAIAFSSSYVLPFAPGVFNTANRSADDLIGCRPLPHVEKNGNLTLTMIADATMTGNFGLTSGTYWTVQVTPIVVYSDELVVAHRAEMGATPRAAGEYSWTCPGAGYKTFHCVKATAQDYSAFAEPTDLVVDLDGVSVQKLVEGDTLNRAFGWMGEEPANKQMDDGQIVIGGHASAFNGKHAGEVLKVWNAAKADAAAAYHMYHFTRAPFPAELESDLVQQGVAPTVARAIRVEYETAQPQNGERTRLRTAEGAPILALPDARIDRGMQRRILFVDAA